jgi:hypothetical protein
VRTGLGGVLYLVNLMKHLDLPACFEETWGLAGQVGAWGVLELLGRGLLGAEGAPLAADPLWAALARLDGRQPGTLPGHQFVGRGDLRLPDFWPAGVAAALPRSDSLSSSEGNASSPNPNATPQRHPLLRGLNPDLAPWLALVLPYLRHRLWLALGGALPDGSDPVTTLLRVPGRLYVTSSHVDLVVALNDVWLPARVAGLDFDPGWLPDFGRVVQFHFQ